jgi:hypothetical protein
MSFRVFNILTLWIITSNLLGQEVQNKSNLLLLSADYASNTNTFGITTPVKQPMYISSLSYFSKYNFDLSLSGIIAGNSDSTYSYPTFEQTISAGYSLKFSEKWGIYPSYSHTFHSKNAYKLTSIFSDIIQNDLNYFGKFYNFSLTTNLILGERNMFFLSLENAINHTFEDLIIKNSSLTFQLGFFLNFSDNNYYNEYFFNEFEREYFLSWAIETFSFRELIMIRETYYKSGLSESKKYILENYPEFFEPDYKLTSIDFYLPVYYSINNFLFSITGILNIPTTDNIFFKIDNSILISLGFSYAFGI